jgi:hypothetical protein
VVVLAGGHSRNVHVWGLLAAEAGRRGQSISIAVACHAAVRVLAVDGASVAAVGPGDVRVSVFATNPLGRRLEELESTLGEGPGLQAHSEGAPVLTSDIRRYGAHWPLFGSAAVEAGVRGMFAFPLRSGTVAIGVFQVHRKDPGVLSTEQLGDALVLADIMSLLLLGSEGENGGDFVQDAISSDHHTEVHQATGMISVHLGVSLTDALARLRGHAFAHGQSISTVAHEIVQGRLRLAEGDTND